MKFEAAKRSRAVAGKRYGELNATLRELSIPFTAGYDLGSERFVITVESQSDVETVRAALPKARRFDTAIEVGILPKTEALPTGVQAGDQLYGGSTPACEVRQVSVHCQRRNRRRQPLTSIKGGIKLSVPRRNHALRIV